MLFIQILILAKEWSLNLINIDKNTLYEMTIKLAFGYSLSTFWQHIYVDLNNNGILIPELLSIDGVQFRECLFLTFLKKAFLDNKIKFVKNGTEEIIDLPIDDLISLIKSSLPAYNSEDSNDDLDDIGMWFWVKCPVGIVWVCEDSSYIWT
ncbi:DUF596 domain-containing protein [Wohlfahrtiimonas populi]|uniref:DUF596 domain-containing protein n=1 Tax=Wohlfahrtiimonas populi TaxID=1940240 RepID=UPI00098D5C0C|nr:DUF596 domain-containing protein [Wohlfahrtiimonas populi]